MGEVVAFTWQWERGGLCQGIPCDTNWALASLCVSGKACFFFRWEEMAETLDNSMILLQIIRLENCSEHEGHVQGRPAHQEAIITVVRWEEGFVVRGEPVGRILCRQRLAAELKGGNVRGDNGQSDAANACLNGIRGEALGPH